VDDAREPTRERRESAGKGEGAVESKSALQDLLEQRRTLDQLHDRGANPVEFLEAVDGVDIRMMQRRDQLAPDSMT
jgi:hypothetical protein